MLELFVLLTIKHAVADLMLQSMKYKPGSKKKSEYPMGGQWHYLDHSALTFCVFIFFVPWPMALLAAITDHVFHWHIDYAKQRYIQWRNIPIRSMGYWNAACVDQILHFITYYILVITFYI